MLEDALRVYAKFEDRTTDPATPAAGEGLVYVKDGKLHTKDDAGTVVEYGTGGGGGGDGALTLLDTVTLGSDGTITFTSISGGYNDLVLVGLLRDDDAAETVNSIQMRVGNGTVDTGSNYGYFTYSARGDNTGNVSSSSNSATAAFVGRTCVANGATAGRFTPVRIELFEYANTAVYRQYLAVAADWRALGNNRHSHASGEWQNTTDAINIVQLLGDAGGSFKAGSKVRLYGRL